jgi:tetratricopeptide (TPR) repeat protein
MESQAPVETVDPVDTPAVEDKAAERVEPTSDSVMHRVFAAELMGNEGDLEGAAGEYLEAAMESNDPEIARRAARVAIAAQSWQHAAMAADRWALLEPESLDAHETAAVSQLRIGDYAAAEMQLDWLLRLMPERAQAWTLVASLLGQTQHPEKASRVLQNLLAAHGDQENADALHAQSQFAARSGNRERALAISELALAVEPERLEFIIWAGRLSLSLQLSDKALDYFRQASELAPEDHDLALAYADLLARDGNTDEVRAVLSGMKQVPDVMLSRILFEVSVQNTDAAEMLYQQFEGMEFEDQAEKAFYQARSAEALGKFPDAIDHYGRVNSGQREVEAGIRRAELMAREGDLAGARRELADLRSGGDAAVMEQSWLTEAQLLRIDGNIDEARVVLNEALTHLNQSVTLMYTRALLAAEQGDVKNAEIDLRIIIGLEPDNAAALNALGYTLADRTTRFDEARRYIEHAYEIQPDDPSIIDSMGWVAFRQGRLQEAERYLRRAWELDNNPEIAAHLGEVLWILDRYDEAREVWRSGAEIDEANAVLKDTLNRLDVSL